MNGRARLLRGVALALGVLLASCGESENPLYDVVPGGGFASGELLMRTHEQALERRDAGRYASTLTDDFRFVVRADVADRYPWLVDGGWDRAEELGMITNLMDPEFEGDVLPVVGIDAYVRPISETTLPDGTLEWTYQLGGTVFIGEFTGWAVDALLVFEMTPDEHGLYLIREIREIAAGPAIAGELTWGGIKARYR